jgi:hypothetical protein
VPDKRPDLATRSRTWDLAIKLGRELGSAIDPSDLDADGAPAKPARKARAARPDYGPD